MQRSEYVSNRYNVHKRTKNIKWIEKIKNTLKYHNISSFILTNFSNSGMELNQLSYPRRSSTTSLGRPPALLSLADTRQRE